MSAEDRVVADHARFAAWAQFARDHGETPAIPAATVVILRDSDNGPETLMLRKNSKIAFGGMWVFPGGRVDDEDWRGANDDVAAARQAASREAAEEAQLSVDPASMVLFAHWIPPAIAPKRYATWFFAARAGVENAVIDDGEIIDMNWLTPNDCMARHHRGEVELAPPTWVTLHTIANEQSVADVLEMLAQRTPRHHATKIVRSDLGPVALWEGDAGYPDGDAGIDGTRHRLSMFDSGYVYDDSGVV